MGERKMLDLAVLFYGQKGGQWCFNEAKFSDQTTQITQYK